MENRGVIILTIDDNQDNLTILSTLILESFPDANVLSALNGQRGLELAAREEPDIILLDIIMPGMDGYEVCRRLKQDARLCDIPVVFVTAIQSNKESRIRALECGAESFLSKPIDDIELTAQIRAMLKIRAANIQKRDEKQLLAAMVKEKTKELKAANAELKESEAKYRYLFENSSVGKSLTQPSGEIEVNVTFCNMLGYTSEELRDKKDQKLTHPDDIELTELNMNELISGKKKEARFNKRYIRKDGSIMWAEVLSSVRRREDGSPMYFMTSMIDITDRIEAQEALKQSEERFQLLFNKAPLGYQSLDFDGRFIEVNQKWLDMLGYTREEAIGKWFGDFLCPEYVDGFRKRFPIFKAQGFIHSEFEMLAKNGNRLFVAFEGKIGYDAVGNFLQTHCILKDITDQRKAEIALTESERANRLLLDQLPVGVVLHHADSSISFSNPFANQMLGLSRDQMLNKMVSDPAWCFCNAHGEPLAVEDYPFSLVYRNKKLVNYEMGISQAGANEIRWVLVNGFAIPDRTTDSEQILISFTDISEKKQAEENIQYLAYHDYLTATYNRRYFETAFESKNTLAHYPLTIIAGDLNGLKLINDSFGHQTGDIAIQQFADEIRKHIPDDAVLARVAGDEFAAILTRTSEDEVKQIVITLQSGIRLLVRDSKGNKAGAELTATFGYSTQSFPGEGVDILMKEAESFMYRRKFLENTSKHSNVIDAIMSTLFEKSEREQKHSLRVCGIATAIATAMCLDDAVVAKVRVAGTLHDIGKIGIDESILNKVDRLNTQDWETIRQHPIRSARILASVDEYLDIVPIVKAHHERIDGSGYPAGLSDKQIPLEAKIIAVADSFDAMTVTRPYREAISKEQAAEELKACVGSQFDGEIVEVFVSKVLPYMDQCASLE